MDCSCAQNDAEIQFPLSYISRASAKDDNRHVILGTQWYKPKDFAVQMNVNLANGWGIVRTIVDLVMKQGEGKYCLIRDPNSVCTVCTAHSSRY